MFMQAFIQLDAMVLTAIGTLCLSFVMSSFRVGRNLVKARRRP